MVTSVMLLVASAFVAPDFTDAFPPSIRTIGVVMPASVLDRTVFDGGVSAFLGEGVTGLQWLGTAFIVGSAVIETRGRGG